MLWTVHPDLLEFPEEGCCSGVPLGFSGENKQGRGGEWGVTKWKTTRSKGSLGPAIASKLHTVTQSVLAWSS